MPLGLAVEEGQEHVPARAVRLQVLRDPDQGGGIGRAPRAGRALGDLAVAVEVRRQDQAFLFLEVECRIGSFEETEDVAADGAFPYDFAVNGGRAPSGRSLAGPE